jgi:hypothetical protein
MMLKLRRWVFEILLIVVFFCDVNGTRGENLGELAAENAISLVKFEIPYYQNTGDSNSKGFTKEKGFLEANDDLIKSDGIDCSGLVMWAYNKAIEGTTITDPIKTNDPTSGANALLIATTKTNTAITTQSPSEGNLRPGDLIFLQNTISGSSGIDHVAMYVGNGYVVHSSLNGGDLNNVLATEAKGSQGTITDGPKVADGLTWWEIEYEDGTKGWSSQNALMAVDPPLVPSDVSAAIAAFTIGVLFQKGSLVMVTPDKGEYVRSTATKTSTGVTMLSLDNWLTLPIKGGTTYKDHLYGYGGPDSITIDLNAAPTPGTAVLGSFTSRLPLATLPLLPSPTSDEYLKYNPPVVNPPVIKMGPDDLPCV